MDNGPSIRIHRLLIIRCNSATLQARRRDKAKQRRLPDAIDVIKECLRHDMNSYEAEEMVEVEFGLGSFLPSCCRRPRCTKGTGRTFFTTLLI
jgi:hypothetical protein